MTAFVRALAGVALIALAPAALAVGGLTWARTAVELTTGPEPGVLKATFPFTNGSSHRITLVAIEPGCHCTTATVTARSLEPGATAQVDVAFDPGRVSGSVERDVTITTDERNVPPTVLALRVNLGTYCALQPAWLNWKVGGAAGEHTIVCTAQTSHRVMITGCRTHAPVTVRIEAAEPGRKYVVHVVPTSVAKPTTAMITLDTVVAGVGPREFRAFVEMN